MKALFLGLALLGAWQERAATIPDDEQKPTDAGTGLEFVLEDSKGQPQLYFPRDEALTFRVDVDIAFFDAALGEVTQTCKIEPYEPSVLLQGSNGDTEEKESESVAISIRAKGDYAFYSLDTTIESRHLPQAWPTIMYRQVSDGSSKRRRENMIGTRAGVPTSSYRKDTSRGAPEGTRIWKESESREVPPDTLDMLSAVFACRTLIREGKEEISFPMIEKNRLWKLTLRRGKEKRVRTGAGTFEAVEVLLIPEPWPDEEIEEENKAKFEGLFGMRGSIHMWVDKATGVTLRIQGDLPAGPFTLGVDVVLESYSGTPEGFAPIVERSEE